MSRIPQTTEPTASFERGRSTMKKNIVGHMAKPNESALSKVRKLHILPMLTCLLLALAIWLTVVDITRAASGTPDSDATQTEETV